MRGSVGADLGGTGLYVVSGTVLYCTVPRQGAIYLLALPPTTMAKVAPDHYRHGDVKSRLEALHRMQQRAEVTEATDAIDAIDAIHPIL